MRQGEIRQRLDTASPEAHYVLVLSGKDHIASRHGRVIVCRVLPATSSQDFAGVHRINYTVDGVTTIGVAAPAEIAWMPRSGLGRPVGLVPDMRPVLKLVRALFE